MAFGTVMSATISGINVEMINVEADVSNGLPMFNMVGYLSSEVKEAGERVRTALKNSGFEYPVKKIIINLSPATIRKRGAIFDLPIAISIMVSAGQIHQEKLKNILVIGELGLDGKLLRVNGLLAIVMEAKRLGITTFIVPKENQQEGDLVEGVEVHSFVWIREVYDFLSPPKLKKTQEDSFKDKNNQEEAGKETDETKKKTIGVVVEAERESDSVRKEVGHSAVDFADIYGQKAVKRAIEIAVAGGHNVLLIGPPGSGKSLIAQAISSILPPLKNDEMLEITKIYSVMGLLKEGNPLITTPPFRPVHHTTTKASLVGGGKIPRIGEITLAHKGILYLDELPEFSRTAIEVLRQPLEDKGIQITRTVGSYYFPADFILVCAMNPCPCGMYPDLEKCNCSPTQISNYLGKISQPFLDRIDICIEVPRLKYADLQRGGRNKREEIEDREDKGIEGEERKEGEEDPEKKEESSKTIRNRVKKAREKQQKRNQKDSINANNANLTPREMGKHCMLDEEGERLMEQAYHKLNLTARSYHKILKVSRTIADMDESEHIQPKHIREAIVYRTLDKKYWR